MNLVSVLILAVVLLLAVAATVYYLRLPHSCNGPCAGCPRTDCPHDGRLRDK